MENVLDNNSNKKKKEEEEEKYEIQYSGEGRNTLIF
jgi:hypothetical protein